MSFTGSLEYGGARLLGADGVEKLKSTVAGDGIAINAAGSVLSVGVDDSGIEISGDALRLKDNGVTLAKMAGLVRGKLISGD